VIIYFRWTWVHLWFMWFRVAHSLVFCVCTLLFVILSSVLTIVCHLVICFDHCLSSCHLFWPLFVILSSVLTIVCHLVICFDHCLSSCHLFWPLFVILSSVLTIVCHLVICFDHCLSSCHLFWSLSICFGFSLPFWYSQTFF
jgi:hypothetical protein